MNKIILTLLIAFPMLFLNSLGHSQQAKKTTKWQTNKYNNPEKLSRLDFLYDSQGRLFYLLTNDEDNIYIHIRATDEVSQKKLINYGFTIEIKSKECSKKKLTIEYPMHIKDRMVPTILLPDNSHTKRNNFNLTKVQIVSQISQMKIRGLTDKESSSIIAANNKLTINGSMVISKNGDLQYLLAIPLSSLEIDLSENKPVKIKMVSGSLNVSYASSQQSKGGRKMSSRSGGGRSQGKGGGQGGGRGKGSGDRGGSSENKEQRMTERQLLTTPIKINIRKVMLVNENK